MNISIKHPKQRVPSNSGQFYAEPKVSALRRFYCSRGTKDQLLIDRAVRKNCRRRKVGLSMVWIDYRNAYELIPCPWIKKSMETCGVADNISHLLCKNMESWKTILMLGNEELDRVNIQRGIFQGDSLSPLLFVIGLIPLIQTLRKVNAGNTNLKRVSTKRSITVSLRMI